MYIAIRELRIMLKYLRIKFILFSIVNKFFEHLTKKGGCDDGAVSREESQKDKRLTLTSLIGCQFYPPFF